MATYYENFSKCKTERELMSEIQKQVKIAIFLGANPDRLKAIEDAGNKVSIERCWSGDQL